MTLNQYLGVEYYFFRFTLGREILLLCTIRQKLTRVRGHITIALHAETNTCVLQMVHVSKNIMKKFVVGDLIV